MRAATLEMDVRTGDPEGNLAVVLAGLRAAAAEGAGLVALPEMWATGFSPGIGEAELAAAARALEAAAAASAQLGLAFVGSGPVASEDLPLPLNRAHVVDAGRVVASHDKVHLFSPTAEHLAFSAGQAPPPVVELPAVGARVAPVVCYDLRFPAVARAAFRGGADVLVVVAQWPEARAPHWGALLRGRAVETQAHVIGCNRIGEEEIGRRRMRLRFPGGSDVIGPDGRSVAPVLERSLEASGRPPSRLTVHELDLDRSRKLRREVPVARDERPERYADWLR